MRYARRVRHALVVVSLPFVALLGCGREAPTITGAPAREMRAPARNEVPTKPETVVTTLIGHVGDVVTIEGALNAKGRPRIPWSVPGKAATFVDIAAPNASGMRLEIVAHVEPSDVQPPDCKGRVRMKGNVIVARGFVKSGSTSGAYAEPQLDVLEWSCR